MPKYSLNVNSQKFLGTHFHIANELERFLENSATSKNTSHYYITTVSPLMYAVLSMNDNLLKYTLNEPLINFLRQINKYFNEMIIELENIYPQCNEEYRSPSFDSSMKKIQNIYKKTVADLRNASATNLLEKLHYKNLIIVLISIRNITLLIMELKECLKLSTLLCDLDLTTKAFIMKLEKLSKL